MILIEKGSAPPPALIRGVRDIKRTQDATVCYENLKTKQEVLESLLEEQGYLCAYCMRPIHGELTPADRQRGSKAHIEHIEAQEITRRRSTDGSDLRSLDYNNMLAVCDGHEGYGFKTCDKSRTHYGNRNLAVDPLRPDHIALIGYGRDGRIYSCDKAIDENFNCDLNLNEEKSYLIDGRRKAMEAAQELVWHLKRKYNRREKINSELGRMIKELESAACKREYIGVLIQEYKKRIKR